MENCLLDQGFSSFRLPLNHIESESESRSVVSDSLLPQGLYSSWNSPGQNTEVSISFSMILLQGIFPTQGSNPGLPHCRLILYQLSHKRRLVKTGWWARLPVADSVHPGQSLRICISNNFPMMLMLLV